MAYVGAPANAASAPDPYSGNIDTSCSVDVPAVVEPGKAAVIKLTVSANSPKTPKGKVTVTLSEAGGDAVWTRTVAYNGGTKTVTGPVLPKDDYVARARFKPSGNAFDGSVCTDQYAVDQRDDEPDDGPDGLLPDTGGPALLWLLLGVGLVGGGTATVVRARRRSETPAT